MTRVVDRIVSPHSLREVENMTIYEVLFEDSVVSGGLNAPLRFKKSQIISVNRVPVITEELHMALNAHGISFNDKYTNRTNKLYYIDINADKKNYLMYKHIYEMMLPHLRHEQISKLVDE